MDLTSGVACDVPEQTMVIALVKGAIQQQRISPAFCYFFLLLLLRTVQAQRHHVNRYVPCVCSSRR